MMTEEPLVSIRGLRFKTDGDLGSCCEEVRVAKLDLFKGRIFFIAGDSRQGKGALCSALVLLLRHYGGRLGTHTSVTIMQKPHTGRPRSPIRVDSMRIRQIVRIECVTDLNEPRPALDDDTIVVSDDPGEPAAVLPIVTQAGATLVVASEPDRLVQVMQVVARHEETQFMWLRCGHVHCGPMLLVDFCQSVEQHCRTYFPPSPGHFKDIVGTLRSGVWLVNQTA